MYLISTGRTTVLSEFTGLETKSIYQHLNGETTDFQFYPRQRVFVEVNKKSGLEILRIKENPLNQDLEIQRVRKLTVENVYCVACAKQSPDELALGLSNGQVKLYNYKKAKIEHRFKAENIRNSVLYLDYNASDEFIASVFESGQINIYGMTTRARLDTINIDGTSTLARFHPTKRVHLSIASYKGSVTVYDVNAKRKIFNSNDSHAAPCRDLCMSAGAPDTLISVGYDCVINIFDTRRRTQPQQINYCHPLSTVAMTECGTYFCVGNLKGELTTLDMRNTKVCLATRKVHDCAVTRIAFVPQSGEDVDNTSIGSVSANKITECHLPSGGDLRKSIVTASASTPGAAVASTRPQRDSFCDFLDFQANKGNAEKLSSRFSTRRDSYDWDALTRKQPLPSSSGSGSNSDDNRGSLLGIGSGLSSIGSANNSVASDSTDGKLNDSATDFVNIERRRRIKVDEACASTVLAPLRDRNNFDKLSIPLGDKLMKIQEEQTLPNQIANTSTDSDKENPPTPSPMNLELGNRLRIHADGTPNRSPMEGFLPSSQFNSPKPPAPPKAAAPPTSAPVNTAVNTDLAQQIAELRDEMNARFRQLDFELKFNSDTNKWQIFTHASRLFHQQMDMSEELRDCMGLLMQSDPFVQEFLRVTEENRELKAQLHALESQK